MSIVAVHGPTMLGPGGTTPPPTGGGGWDEPFDGAAGVTTDTLGLTFMFAPLTLVGNGTAKHPDPTGVLPVTGDVMRDAESSDHYTEFTATLVDGMASWNWSLWVRCIDPSQGSNQGFRASTSNLGSGDVEVFKDGNVAVGSFPWFININQPFTIRAEAQGDQYRLLVDGVEKVIWTDPAPSSGTQCCFQIGSNKVGGMVADSFKGGSL